MQAADDFVEVPDFVGLTVDAALTYAELLGVQIAGTEPDGTPIRDLSGRVIGQRPAPDSHMSRTAVVVLTVEENGGAGVRERRRPSSPRGTLEAGPRDDS